MTDDRVGVAARYAELSSCRLRLGSLIRGLIQAQRGDGAAATEDLLEAIERAPLGRGRGRDPRDHGGVRPRVTGHVSRSSRLP
jgi:hypothetical protein